MLLCVLGILCWWVMVLLLGMFGVFVVLVVVIGIVFMFVLV